MEQLQPLGGGFDIYVSDIHHFGTDAIMLADFARPRRDERACDLGTGCGIVPFLWCARGHRGELTAVEISSDAAEMAARSAERNGVADRVSIINADLRTLTERHRGLKAAFSLVTMNPPYKAAGDGAQSPDKERRTARHEMQCTLNDVCTCAAALLTFGGRLCMCHRPDRLCDIMVAMRQSGVEPKRLRLVCQRAGARPMLVLIEGKRGGKPGLVNEPPLYVEDEKGEFSAEMLEIYGRFKADWSDKK